jgi:hypothetical protein
MLLPREQSPWNCGYFLGAIALQALKNSPGESGDLQYLQRQMGAQINRDISARQVITAAAWLFLAGAIELDEDGMVRRCS